MKTNIKILITAFIILLTTNLFSQEDQEEMSKYTKGYYKSHKDNRQLFRKIFRTAYMPPAVIILYTTAWYSHNNKQLISSPNTKFTNAVQITDKYKQRNFSFNFDWYFTDFAIFKWGVGIIGLERNIYNTKLSYSNYSDNFFHTDIDNEDYYKYIYGNNITEEIKLINYTTPVSGNLKLSLIPRLVEMEFKVGAKIHLRNVLKIKYKGTYTYHGAYERYGGVALPLHDIERYGFYTNKELENEVPSLKIKPKQPFQLFVSIGIAAFVIPSIKIGASLVWVDKMTYKQETKMDDYYLTKNIEDHHSVFETRNITGKSDFYLKIKLSYHITNQSNVVKYYKFFDK